MLKTDKQQEKERQDGATESGMSEAQLRQFISNGVAAQGAVNQATKQQHIRVVTVTITGPDAGPIAAGMTTAFSKIARDIEGRRAGTTVRVQMGHEV